jgi:hypothetical protein
MKHALPPLRWTLLAGLVLCLGGCGGRGPRVQGSVTLNGGALAEGTITFFPVEGTAATSKGDIRAGRYEVANLAPGPRRVLISVPPRAEVLINHKGEQRAKVSRDDLLSPRAGGNNEIVTISGQQQTLDFHLQQKQR